MRHRLIMVRHISADDEHSWRDLGTRAIEPNPFCEPDCVIPAAIHQAYGAEIGLVVAEDQGRFMACVPFRYTTRWKIPYPVVTSQVRRMPYLGTPLVDESAGVEAVATLLAGLTEQRRVHRGRILHLEAIAADGPVADCSVPPSPNSPFQVLCSIRTSAACCAVGTMRTTSRSTAPRLATT